ICINILREGLDMPEVSLVAVLDADKEGFLRSDRALIQTIGRAARNVNGRAIFYADKMTGSILRAYNETKRRREKQLEYNKAHNITPETIKSKMNDILVSIYEKDYVTIPKKGEVEIELTGNVKKDIETLEKEMYKASENLDFEKAAKIRDILFEYRMKS
ncbi:MAG: UvrB/UvrC motif-containing protein, partial [Deferribacterales bacterium]|nr:UvrB/UvrC motif-containing protein [Deferribacterales bacterium]